MTTADELLALASRVEAATDDQPALLCEALDAALAGGWVDRAAFYRAKRMLIAGASLDAALTLVPEGSHWRCGVLPEMDGHFADVVTACGVQRIEADTPALALTAAALRARAAVMEGAHG